uniref:PKS_AT domain-containing protein n=1 Tax=Steinernema glaseri TaxID=37863 RepID=A0A1I7ZJB8_9BILA
MSLKRVLPQLLTSVRGVRKRLAPPVEWLKDATTYSEAHSVVTDPYTSPPYPQEDMQSMYESSIQSAKDAKRQKELGRMKRKVHTIDFSHVPIEDQVVLLFPGQGAQHVKMGSKVYDCDASKKLFDNASEVLGYDLYALCQEGPSTKLNQTIYSQPAVFVSSLAALEKLRSEQPDIDDRITDAAGFSVGEYAALVAGGCLSFEDALRIVKVRAEAMHECCQLIASGMMTIRVNASSRLKEALFDARQVAEEKNELAICEEANFLFCQHRVIGGSQTCLGFLEANAQKYNFDVLKRLPVSGAFHTRLMNEALVPVKQALKEAKLEAPRLNIYSNYSGKVYPRKLGEIRDCITKQINNPVKWEQIQQLLYRKHQDFKFPNFIEVGPGRQLGSMLVHTSKKAYKSYTNYPC